MSAKPGLLAGGVLGVALATGVADTRIAAGADRTEEIISRASAYAVEFLHQFTNIVAEERYVQDATRRAVAPSKGKSQTLPGLSLHRSLASDFLLVQLPGLDGWHTFRDVFEVDGRAVRDREERLSQLFLQPAAAAVEQARTLEREGIRYNLGDALRSLNNPLLPMGMLQPQYRKRFRFSMKDPDREIGPDVVIVEFREQDRPTVLRRFPDGDLPAKGRLWIDSRTGRVAKTELTVSESDAVTTTFRFDDDLRLDVPAEMREEYWTGGTLVTGTAVYSRFRRFNVRTEETIKRP
jgi:hypothetical protein